MSVPLLGFFSGPNEVSISELTNSQADLLVSLAGHVDGSALNRTVLPARAGGATRWYGFSSSGAEERLLLEELRSWVGAPIGSRVRQVTSGSPDPLDLHAVAVGGDLRVVVTTISEANRQQAQVALRGLSQMWSMLPDRVRKPDRPVGRVLRDFYQALVAGNRPIAEAALQEVELRGLLSSTNVRFLLVDLIDKLGTSSEMRSEKRLAGLAFLERPPRVTESLARAADELFFEYEGDVAQPDVGRTAIALEECWPGLVRDVAQVASRASARCLAAVESLADSPRSRVIGFLANGPWSNDAFVATVVAQNAAIKVGGQTSAYELLIAGELDQALSQAVGSGDSDDLTVAVFAAYELGTEGAARTVLDALGNTPSSLAENPTVAQRIEALREHLNMREEAENWRDWLRGVGSGDLGRLDRLRDWSTQLSQAPLADPRYVSELTSELFDALNDERRSNVRNALPLIIESLVGDGQLEPQFVATAVLTSQVTLASDAGAAERALVLTLTDQVLECGCTATEYSDLLEALGDHFAVVGSRAAEFIADAVSLIVDGPALAEGARANFYARAVAAATSMIDRVEPVEVLVLQQALAAAGVSLPLPDLPEEDRDERRSAIGVLMIYSLAESAARRAAEWISASNAGIEIRISTDKVNSDRLVASVRASAVVLVHTSKATHAATNAISAAASGGNEIVWVNGRGASSIFRAFLAWRDA